MDTHHTDATVWQNGNAEGYSLASEYFFHSWSACSLQDPLRVNVTHPNASSSNFTIKGSMEHENLPFTSPSAFQDVSSWQPEEKTSSAVTFKPYKASPSTFHARTQLLDPHCFHQFEQPKLISSSCEISATISQPAISHDPYHHDSSKLESLNLVSFGKLQAGSGCPPFGNCWFSVAASQRNGGELHGESNRRTLFQGMTGPRILDISWMKPFEANAIKSEAVRIQVRHPFFKPQAKEITNQTWYGQPKGHIKDVLTSRCASVPYVTGLTNKPRIRWTQELHEEFVKAVNRLGSAEKATPKEIQKIMNLDGLTICHIKSHLQKYRIAKHTPSFVQGKNQRNKTEETSPMDLTDGMHITEALHLQMDVQRSLHEQLEIQRNLQIRIEEHARYLEKIFDQQNRRMSCPKKPKSE
ncbi:unnamed protein product [Victoria cruziana]